MLHPSRHKQKLELWKKPPDCKRQLKMVHVRFQRWKFFQHTKLWQFLKTKLADKGAKQKYFEMYCLKDYNFLFLGGGGAPFITRKITFCKNLSFRVWEGSEIFLSAYIQVLWCDPHPSGHARSWTCSLTSKTSKPVKCNSSTCLNWIDFGGNNYLSICLQDPMHIQGKPITY